MQRFFYSFIFALLLFSCSSSDQSDLSETAEEAATPEEELIAYSQDEVQEVEGLRVYSQLTPALNENNRPITSRDYLYSAQSQFYVYTTFNGIKPGPHESQCNISTDVQKNAIVGSFYHFTAESNGYNVWNKFSTSILYDGTSKKPLNGATKAFLEVYLDGKLVSKKEINLLTEEQALSGEYDQYWRDVNYFTTYAAKEGVQTGDSWGIRYIGGAPSNILAVYPVTYEGLNRFFVVLRDAETNKLSLHEIVRNKVIKIRDFNEEDYTRLFFSHYLEGSTVYFYNEYKTHNTSYDLTSGQLDYSPTIQRAANKVGTYIAPDMNSLMSKSCNESKIVIRSDGMKVWDEEMNCEEHIGWASWTPDSKKVYYDKYKNGIYAYDVAANKQEHILYSPNATFPQYFTNGGIEFIVYGNGNQLVLATKANNIGYFMEEFDYDARMTKVATRLGAATFEVDYLDRPVELFSETIIPEMEGFEINIYKVGNVIKGEYAGAELIKYQAEWVYEDKGMEQLYYDDNREYFIVKNDSLIFLENHFSGKNNYYPVSIKDGDRLSFRDPGYFFQKSKYLSQLKYFFIEENVELHELSLPDKKTLHETAIKKLVEINGNGVDVSAYKLLMTDEDVGDVYVPVNDDGTFHVFLPDGTQGVYTYDFKGKDFEGYEIGMSDYQPYLDRNCAGGSDVMADVVAFDTTKYTPLARLDGRTVYRYKDNEAKALKDRYKRYQEMREAYPHMNDNGAMPSYEEFVNRFPFLFWDDGLGRMVAFANTKYMQPMACEPIVYFYPEHDMQVEVALDENTQVMNTLPKLGKRWNIVAHQNGTFTDSRSGKTYQRLFWEGKAGFLPALEKGFVIERNEIAYFLDEKLTLLGLNKRELQEFKEAWMPELTEKTYCFISFYEEEVINAYAPLNISPKPDRLIRVLMDYEPLEEYKEVSPIQMVKAAPRKGFTVVEWGGMKR